MADDPNLTPADSGPLTPTPAGTSGDPATAEILAVVVPPTDGAGGLTTPPAETPSPTPPRAAATRRPVTGAAGAGPGPAATAAEAPATDPASPASPAVDLPGATAALTAAASNETPTITKPAARPRPPATPRPPPARPMTPPPTAPATTPSSGSEAAPVPARPQADWAAEIADRIDEVVAKVRANTSDRLVGIVRMVVYGLLAAILGLTALVLLLILFFRVLAVIPGPVWIPYLVLGAIFVAGGRLSFARAKRTPKPQSA